MKNTNRLAFALLATGALSTLGARGLPLGMPALAQEGAAQAPDAGAKATRDAQALALLQQSSDAYKALSSYSGTTKMEEILTGRTPDISSGTVRWRKPNRFALQVIQGGATTTTISNGTSVFFSQASDKARYIKQEAPTDPISIAVALGRGSGAGTLAQLLSGQSFAQQFELDAKKDTVSVSMGEPGVMDGTPVDIVLLTSTGPQTGPQVRAVVSLAMGRDDHLLRQAQVKISGPGPKPTKSLPNPPATVDLTSTETHSNVQINPDLPASTFAFTPPKGAKPVESLEPPRYNARLKKGAAPIAFTATDTSGKPLSLAQFKGRVVLLDFWATWCGPCVGEVPNIVAAHQKYRAKGFDVVGVSLDQDRKALDAFVKQYKMPWRQVFDGQGWKSRVPGLYGVRSIPFALLIGRDGKIAAMDVRGEALEPAIKAALAKK